MGPRPWIAAAIGLAATLNLMTPAGAAVKAKASNQTTGSSDQSQAAFLWSQDASGGSLTGPSDTNLTLELHGLRPYVTRFTDHPARDSAIASNVDFYARWPARFATNPPNGVLSYVVGGQPQPVSIVLTLSSPRYDAKHHRIRYAASRLRKKEDAQPDTSTRLVPPVIPNPRNFGPAVLFIDSASGSGAAAATLGPKDCPVDGISGVPYSGWYIQNLVNKTCAEAQSVFYSAGGGGLGACQNYKPFNTWYGVWGCQNQGTQAPFAETTAPASFFAIQACRVEGPPCPTPPATQPGQPGIPGRSPITVVVADASGLPGAATAEVTKLRHRGYLVLVGQPTTPQTGTTVACRHVSTTDVSQLASDAGATVRPFPVPPPADAAIGDCLVTVGK